jgi:hypothetical protein
MFETNVPSLATLRSRSIVPEPARCLQFRHRVMSCHPSAGCLRLLSNGQNAPPSGRCWSRHHAIYYATLAFDRPVTSVAIASNFATVLSCSIPLAYFTSLNNHLPACCRRVYIGSRYHAISYDTIFDRPGPRGNCLQFLAPCTAASFNALSSSSVHLPASAVVGSFEPIRHLAALLFRSTRNKHGNYNPICYHRAPCGFS